MNEVAKIYWLHALTPIHVGVGRGIGFIDLPIIREKATNWPIVPGSAVKGVLRDYYQLKNIESMLINTAFGEPSDTSELAGALVLTDARIVLLPVRSLYGTFAYVTSPLALQRFKKDMASIGEVRLSEIPEVGDGSVQVTAHSKLVSKDGKVFLEDLDFNAITNVPMAAEWALYFGKILFNGDEKWEGIFRERFVIVSDQTFDFLTETATEIRARIKIQEETKTVEEGALWYEESLPAETIMAGIAWCDRTYGGGIVTPKQILSTFCDQETIIQIGGMATTGKGRARCLFTKGV